MKKPLIITFLAVSLLAGITNQAYATGSTNATSTVTGTVPVLNTVTQTGGSLTISVAPDTGLLASPISSTFSVFTNNNSGVKVQFTATDTTTTGSVNALAGTTANSNTGTIVLTNGTVLPTSAAVTNALSTTATPANNANAVAYSAVFTGTNGSTAANPVFVNVGDSLTTVTAPVGTTNFTVQLNNNTTLLNNTFSDTNDLAGSYTATISCTVSSP